MANTYTLIASSTVSGATAASISFTSIPSTYTDLCLKISARTNAAGWDNMVLQFNGSSTGYTYRFMNGNGSATSSSSGSSSVIGLTDYSGATANTFGNAEIYIPNYAGSNNKSYSGDFATENNATTAYAELWANLWSNSSAISSIAITAGGSFVQYTTAYLYGVKNA